jgi:pyruvate/2-oxoglutarate dehydrogenase complex dihydrolipoamide acyltransferase (E2) component
MPKKLNVRDLLQGTQFEDQAEILATKIEGWGMDNDYDIHNLSSHGLILGINPNVIVAALLEQEAKQPAEEITEAPAVKEPDWLKATPSAAELAEEYGIDLSTVDGSGKDGTIVKKDVELFIEED